MTNKKTINVLLAGAVAAVSLGLAGSAHAEGEKEKCYGVVKAGKNDCGSADKAHGCAGLAAVDGSGQEWVTLPKGVCEKLVNGSLEPVAAGAPAEEAPAEEGGEAH
ncbi:MAG: DUF2282 domain-containing protein [Alphaproteobacteria bacterium]|nr:DUF2282 domain-containing protein [Alphaproteobacteria bacterium]MCB9974307.1 DUF2282 domain-containing protein [Rhodospirillales bacterium]